MTFFYRLVPRYRHYDKACNDRMDTLSFCQDRFVLFPIFFGLLSLITKHDASIPVHNHAIVQMRLDGLEQDIAL